MYPIHGNSRRILLIVACCVGLLAGEGAFGQVLRGEAAMGGWRDDKPGVRRLLTAQDLPALSKPTYGVAKVVPRPAGAQPQVPEGFTAELVATDARKPRVIRVAPNGDLFVADSMSNSVRVLRVPAGSARPERDVEFASGLTQPYGIAFHPLGPNPRWVYVANSNGVVRFPYKNGDLVATAKPERIIEGISWVHHYGRDIAFSPDGSRLFLSVGSGSNAALDMFPEPHWTMHPEPRNVKGLEEWTKLKPLGAAWDTEELRANVLSFDPDGKDMKIVATGLRNCQAMTIQPATGQLWCAVNERDEIGDNTPLEYATHVVEGAFYGWPWYLHRRTRRPAARRASAPTSRTRSRFPTCSCRPIRRPCR